MRTPLQAGLDNAPRPAARLGLLVALLGWFVLSGAQAEEDPLEVVIPPLEEPQAAYFSQILDLALSKTEDSHGPYTLDTYPYLFTTGRFLAELKRGGIINVHWGTVDRERAEELRPIPIPLLKELNSYRIFLIRDGEQEVFEQVETLDDLRELRAGQGAHWIDADVLRNNGLPVVTSAHYDLLFNMLAGGRFDYFPRGLYEIWEEHRVHEDRGLAIERTLMLYYPAHMYFYVTKDNKALAERIEKGLREAIDDGSFDEVFFDYPGFERGYREITNNQRRVFKLEHPLTELMESPPFDRYLREEP